MLPAIKFDELITIDDWTDALRRTLDAAVEATQAKDAPGRRDLQDLLQTFIKRSPAKVELLDVIAREAIEDLAIAEISMSLERISSRSAELTRATGFVEAATVEAKKDVRQLRLETTLDALAKAKAAIDAIHELEKSLTAPDQSLLQKAKSSADALTALSNALKEAA